MLKITTFLVINYIIINVTGFVKGKWRIYPNKVLRFSLTDDYGNKDENLKWKIGIKQEALTGSMPPIVFIRLCLNTKVPFTVKRVKIKKRAPKYYK